MLDVLIVGAGPTGLLLAGDLAAAAVPVTVLDRRTQESNLSRAFAVHARTLEMLDARGLADELVPTGHTLDRIGLFDPVSLELSRLPSRFPFLLVTSQYHTERLLERRASALGAETVGGSEVTGVRQEPDHVDVEVRAADGATQVRQASYVVGADGVRSVVRRALGLPFPGRSVLRSVMLADVRLTSPPPDLLRANASGEGFAFIARSATAGTASSPGTGSTRSRTPSPSTWSRCARLPGRPWVPITACANPAGCPVSTTTSGRFRGTGQGACSWSATRRMCTPRQAARA